MKISIIGAGNVGGTTALRLAEMGAGEVVLVDIAKGIAKGKAYDLEDARALSRINYRITGSDDISAVSNSDIIVITAGLPRKPGMTREDLLIKNADILKELCVAIKTTAPQSILIIVTNPLDLMARYAIEITGFLPGRVIGMGVSLDAARFANLIAKELNVGAGDVDAQVIASHGEGMMPLARLVTIKGVALEKFIDKEKIAALVKSTVGRGLEIVTLLGSGSAYYAPSAAIAALVRAIVKDERRVIGVSALLQGQYGVTSVCLGVPARIGKEGIEEVIQLALTPRESEEFIATAGRLNEQYRLLATCHA